MMSKIIKAINAMALHPDLINNVTRAAEDVAPDKLYFEYHNKHIWSITPSETGYRLTYFQSDVGIKDIIEAEYRKISFSGLRALSYESSDFTGREVQASFHDLYTIVEEKAFGMSEILDDIIGDTFAY